MPKNNVPKYRRFCFIAYTEDPCHMHLLQWLDEHESIWKTLRILHDKDVYTEDTTDEEGNGHKVGDPKKPHYHVLIECKEFKTVASVEKFFHVWIKHIEGCSDPQSYVLYMLHDTPDSMGKHRYPATDLIGSRDLALLISDVQKSHLDDIFSLFDNTDGSLRQVLSLALCAGDSATLASLKEWQSYLIAMSNQERYRHQEHRDYTKHFAMTDKIQAELKAEAESKAEAEADQIDLKELRRELIEIANSEEHK